MQAATPPASSSSTRCCGSHPERPPTVRAASSAARNAWLMNGLNFAGSGLAQASQAAESTSAIDDMTLATAVSWVCKAALPFAGAGILHSSQTRKHGQILTRARAAGQGFARVEHLPMLFDS